MGAAFYQKVVDLQQRCGKKGDVVSNGLQTNATLIDDEFAAHFSNFRFLPGSSAGVTAVHGIWCSKESLESGVPYL